MASPKNHLSKGLSAKQRLFLDARATAASDEEAMRTVGIVSSSLRRWKGVPIFWDAYRKVTGQLDQTLGESIPLNADERQQLAFSQSEALMKILPGVVQEHIRIALGADKDADRLRAIEKLYAAVGFGKDEAPPVSKQNQVFMQMLDMMAPQVAAEATRRGLPVSSTIKDVVAEDFAKVMARLEEESRGEEVEEWHQP